MALTLNGSTGISGIAGSAGTPALQGNNDANTGYFFAADTLGLSTAGNERLRITSDGKVGINRTTPAAPITARRLDAGGTGTSGVIAEFANSSGYGVWFGQSSASGASWGSTTGDFYWCTGGLSSQTERLRIDSSGNASIGGITAAPTSTVYNSGTLHLHQATGGASGGSQLKMTTSQSGSAASDGAYIAYYGNNEWYFYNKENADISFGTNSSERLRIDSDGRVLIGTTTTGASGVDDLIVNVASGNGGISIRTGVANNGNLYFSDGTSGSSEYRGYLQYRHATDILVLGAAATEKGWVTSEGLVAFSGNGAGASSGYALKVMGGTNHRDYPGIYMEGSTGADNSSIWAKYNLTLGCDSTDAIAGRQVAFSNGSDQIAAFSIDGLLFGSDSAAANALDDYEEGSWTVAPTCQNGSVTLSSSVNECVYVKIGRLVQISGRIRFNTVSSQSGWIRFSLPFTNISSGPDQSALGQIPVNTHDINLNSAAMTTWFELSSGNAVGTLICQQDNGSWFSFDCADLKNNDNEYIAFSGTYQTDA